MAQLIVSSPQDNWEVVVFINTIVCTIMNNVLCFWIQPNFLSISLRICAFLHNETVYWETWAVENGIDIWQRRFLSINLLLYFNFIAFDETLVIKSSIMESLSWYLTMILFVHVLCISSIYIKLDFKPHSVNVLNHKVLK